MFAWFIVPYIAKTFVSRYKKALLRLDDDPRFSVLPSTHLLLPNGDGVITFSYQIINDLPR